MRKLITLFTIAFSVVFSNIGHAQYCTTGLYTTFGCTDNDYVNSFSTSLGSTNITNNNSGCNGGVAGYNFFSTMTHTSMQGTSFNWSFTNTPSFSEGYKIWVDWNGDGDFIDIGEEIYASTTTIGNSATVTGSATVPMTAVPGTTRIRIRCVYATTTFTPCSNHTFGEVEDYNFTVIAATPCSGAPTAGTATASGGCPAAINITGSTLQGNLVWQWQKKTACDTTWVNVPGATSMNFSPAITPSPVDYRAYVICSNSGLSDTTNIVSLANVPACYCTSGATSTFYQDIFNVTVNGVSNSTVCASVGGPGSTAGLYNDYTSVLPPIPLTKGSLIPLSVEIGLCQSSNPFNTAGVAAFIDYNGNGIFDASERVYSSLTSTLTAHTESGSFTVPVTAQTGVTRMRIVNADNSSPSSISACGSFNYGETEDYLVDIKYAPTVTGDTIYCSGESASLTISTPNLSVPNTNVFWTNPNGVSDTSHTISFSSISTANDGLYVAYAITYSCGGNVADTSGPKYFHIYVNPTPPPPVVASVINYCQNTPFDSVSIYGLNVKWYDSAVGGNVIPPPSVNTSVLGSSTFYATQTSLANCESARVPVTINVVPQAAPPTVVSPVVYCQGNPVQPLQATGNNLLYYTVPTGGVGTPITPIPNSFAQGTFTWYVSQTENGCESARVPIVVNVNYTPNAYISVLRPYVCQYDTISVNYFGNAIPTATYTWSVPTGATIISGSGQGPLVVRFDSAGSRRVTLQVDNGGCPGPLAYVDVSVRVSPRFTIDLPNEVCQDDIATLAVNYATPGIDNYTWDFAGGEYVSGTVPGGPSPGPFNLRWNTPGEKIIKALGSDRGAPDEEACLSLPVADTIIVRPLPVADILNLTSGRICAGDSIRFEAYYDPSYSYQWLPQRFFDESSQTTQWGRVDDPGYVTLRVTSEYNCTASDSTFINAEPCCDMAFPNAFTPNDDGKNDRFRAITPGNHKVSHFRIQNRWGQVIYEAADASIGWDGTFNGKPQDMNTYFFYVKYLCGDGKYYEKKGEFVLIR